MGQGRQAKARAHFAEHDRATHHHACTHYDDRATHYDDGTTYHNVDTDHRRPDHDRGADYDNSAIDDIEHHYDFDDVHLDNEHHHDYEHDIDDNDHFHNHHNDDSGSSARRPALVECGS